MSDIRRELSRNKKRRVTGFFGLRGSNGGRMGVRPGTPTFVLILAAVLLSCNFLWLHSSHLHLSKNSCRYEIDSWGVIRPNGSNSFKFDYQLVRGSGSTSLPWPLEIPNNTVLFGSDSGSVDGDPVRFMTIGISSVGRKEDNYLFKTLDSILMATSAEEKNDILVFLLIADANPDQRLKRASEVQQRYKEHFESGLFRVIQPPSSLYPSIDFSSIRRTYGDSLERVQWRTKQVLDFAFLFWYTWSRIPSEYFLILEDDIISAKRFVTATKDFVELHSKHHWVSLQLAGFMGIGQLVRCTDLERLVNFLLNFYLEHPVDILFNHWVKLMAPDKPPKYLPSRRIPGLFQHIGIHSTLANKTQKIQDNTFSLVKRQFSHLNPSAMIFTTIRQYKTFVPEFAYGSAPGMFWGIPKPGDTFDIVFPKPLKLARLVIKTGTTVPLTKAKNKQKKANHLRDKLLFGHVEVSGAFNTAMSNDKRASCHDFVFLDKFNDGQLDRRDFGKTSANGIQCIRIVVETKQKNWVAISEIAVFTLDESLDD